MNRTPPIYVKKKLRREIGFGCPVNDCGRPYLEWHHFDPPWHIKNHHDPNGMVALCREHHIQADNGAFAKDQLHSFKSNGQNNWKSIKGKFNWLRNKILVYIDGNFAYDCPIAVEFKGERLIWFNRDENGYLLLNLNMLSQIKQPRAQLRDNEWFNVGNEEDIECPPSAKSLGIKYPNGDSLRIQFIEFINIDEAQKKYPLSIMGFNHIEFPVTIAEINLEVGTESSGIIDTKKLFGNNIQGNFAINCKVGFSLN